MITHAWRLKKWRIPIVFSKGKRVSNNFFDTKYIKTEAQQSHFCVIVSSKIAASAVERNRLRRQLYEIIRLESPKNNTHADIIIIAKNTAKGKTYEELKENLLLLLNTIDKNS